MSGQVSFREVQAFRQPWLWAILSLPSAILLWELYRQVVLGHPFGNRPMSNGAFLGVIAALLVFLLWFWEARLVTEVAEDRLSVRFVLLFARRVVPVQEIRGAMAVTYSPIKDYGGWGVRFGRRGKAYTVQGDRGVEVELRDGTCFLIGSQRADELAQALNARLSAPR